MGVFKQREFNGFHGCMTVRTPMTVPPWLSIAKTSHNGTLRRFDRTSLGFGTTTLGHRGTR
jgi:hypothetical protein